MSSEIISWPKCTIGEKRWSSRQNKWQIHVRELGLFNMQENRLGG